MNVDVTEEITSDDDTGNEMNGTDIIGSRSGICMFNLCNK